MQFVTSYTICIMHIRFNEWQPTDNRDSHSKWCRMRNILLWIELNVVRTFVYNKFSAKRRKVNQPQVLVSNKCAPFFVLHLEIKQYLLEWSIIVHSFGEIIHFKTLWIIIIFCRRNTSGVVICDEPIEKPFSIQILNEFQLKYHVICSGPTIKESEWTVCRTYQLVYYVLRSPNAPKFQFSNEDKITSLLNSIFGDFVFRSPVSIRFIFWWLNPKFQEMELTLRKLSSF